MKHINVVSEFPFTFYGEATAKVIINFHEIKSES